MYYGIRQSTDIRRLNTEVIKFPTKREALLWKKIRNGSFTYSDPSFERNYHHSFNRVYKFVGRIDRKNEIFQNHGTRDYLRNETDNLAEYIQRYGDEVVEKEERT